MELEEESPAHPGFLILSASGERAAHTGQIADEPAGASAAGFEAGDGRERAASSPVALEKFKLRLYDDTESRNVKAHSRLFSAGHFTKNPHPCLFASHRSDLKRE
jgi:hypothetical protein